MLSSFKDKNGPKKNRERKAIRIQTQNAANLFIFINNENALPTIEGVKNIDLNKQSNRLKIIKIIDSYLEEGEFDKNDTVRVQNFIIKKIEVGLKTNYAPFNDAALAVISMLNSINHILYLYDNEYRDSKLLKEMTTIIVSKCPKGIAKIYKDGLPENISNIWEYLDKIIDL